MKLYVPHLGDDLRLTADWSFTLHDEYRNRDFASFFGMTNPYPYDYETLRKYNEWEQENMVAIDGDLIFKKPAVIPAGTVLRVEADLHSARDVRF